LSQILEVGPLIENQYRLVCDDIQTEADVDKFVEILKSADQWFAQRFEDCPLQFTDERITGCQDLASCYSIEDITQLCNLGNDGAERLFEMLNHCIVGEGFDHSYEDFFLDLDEIELESIDSEGLTDQGFNIRCGLGLVALYCKKFTDELKGTINHDGTENYLQLLFPMETKFEAPNDHGKMETILIKEELEIHVYLFKQTRSPLNYLMFKNMSQTYGSMQKYKEYIERLVSETSMTNVIVFAEE